MPSEALPPWLTRDYAPVESYIRSYAIGAQIGEAQTRIAEQQRQANMEHAAKQQALQANILKAQQEMLLEKAYKDQQLSLENARLTEMGQRNAAEAQHAAAVLRETEARNAIQAAMATRRMTETERHNRALENKAQLFHWQGGVRRYNPETGAMETLSEPQTKAKPTESEIQAKKSLDYAFDEMRKFKIAPKSEEEARQIIPELERLGGNIDRAQKTLDEVRARNKTSVPIPPPTTTATTTGMPPEGKVLYKKDGSRWIVKNGVPVPYPVEQSKSDMTQAMIDAARTTSHDEEE